MGTKSKKDYNDPLAIWNEMKALNQKNHKYYDNLTEEQQKKFSPYLLLRWGACVEGNTELSKYYAVAANEFVNINFWEITKHKKLAWLCLCTISPNIENPKHYWLGSAKKENLNPLRNKLLELLPTTKEKDIDLMLQLNNKEEIKGWLRQCGLQEKDLKAIL